MTQPAGRSWGWVGFFVLLVILAGTAITLPIVYNLDQQLRPEQLAEARLRWQEDAPADYDLSFSIQYDRDLLAERHVVLVRGGKSVFAACEGEVIHTAPALGALLGLPAARSSPEGLRDVSGIFDHLETLQREQQAAPRKNFLIAVFDPRYGFPRRFIRRVRGTSTREEWNLLLWRPGELGTGTPLTSRGTRR